MTCIPWQPNMGCASEWLTFDDDLRTRSQEMAWATMRLLTGGMVGNCEVIYRPCVPEPCTTCASSWMTTPYSYGPYVKDGQWHNQRCGDTGCSCVQLSEVVFPGRVAEVVGVLVDGQPLSPGAYRVDHNNRLLRTDGGKWPSCQDMRLPETADGAFAVHYIPGIKPSGAGLWAVGVLAYEFSKACSGEKCRLPSSVTSITRQGVSMQFDNSMFSNGLTGIREVDAYILSVNPNKIRIPPMVWSPDVERGRGTNMVGYVTP